MHTFKQWYDNDIFRTETPIYFCQADMHHRLTLAELLRRTADAAVEDYRQRGLSWEFLTAQEKAILVSRLSFRFHRMPSVNECITISTWEEKPEVLQLVRAYEITSATGEPLVSGISSWLVVDLKTRHLMRTNGFTLRPTPTAQREHDCLPTAKITAPSNMRMLGERTIRYSDIDGNGHVDNARYAEYVIDSLPAEYQHKTFTDFRMNYSKEAMLGDTLTIYGSGDDAAQKIIVVGKHPNGICFESELWYR
ncbi:MAG: acyl-[Treponema sp.]|nr:acyl-[acyl-carrier-protein] thioesterase [Treponema sp.]